MSKWKIFWWVLGAIFVVPVAIRFTIWIISRIIRAFTGQVSREERKVNDSFEEEAK